MARHTLKNLQQILQDFLSVSDHFTTLRSKELNAPARLGHYMTAPKKLF